MNSKLMKKASAAVLSAAMAVNGAAISTASIVTAADAGAVKYEFEDGTMTGTGGAKDDKSASGGSYYFLESNSDSCTLTVDAPETGMYKITICYNAEYGEKIQNLYVNGVDQGQVSFTSEEWTELDCGTVKLNKGENEIMIKSSWGWTNFDYLTIAPAELAKIQATQTDCSDINASAETRAKRRLAELNEKGNFSQSYEEVLADIVLRDKHDSERATAPLIKVADAFEIDTSVIGIDETLNLLLSKLDL